MGTPEGLTQLETLLVILADLNAIEALPQLLKLEGRLNAKVDYGEVARDADATTREFSGHAQVLSLLITLLQNEKAPGLTELQTRPAEDPFSAYPELYGGKSSPPARETVYNQANRDRIVRAAETYRQKTNPDDYRGARAMAPDAVTR